MTDCYTHVSAAGELPVCFEVVRHEVVPGLVDERFSHHGPTRESAAGIDSRDVTVRFEPFGAQSGNGVPRGEWTSVAKAAWFCCGDGRPEGRPLHCAVDPCKSRWWASPFVFGPGTLSRTWGTLPVHSMVRWGKPVLGDIPLSRVKPTGSGCPHLTRPLHDQEISVSALWCAISLQGLSQHSWPV
jgi:hypothetical protein